MPERRPGFPTPTEGELTTQQTADTAPYPAIGSPEFEELPKEIKDALIDEANPLPIFLDDEADSFDDDTPTNIFRRPVDLDITPVIGEMIIEEESIVPHPQEDQTATSPGAGIIKRTKGKRQPEELPGAAILKPKK